MSKIKEQLRPTIIPSNDVTRPERGFVTAPEEAWDLIEAVDELNAKGLMGILDDLADECLDYLKNKGLNVRLSDGENSIPVISFDELVHLAQTDPHTNEIAAILMGVFHLRREALENNESSTQKDSFALQAFLVGAAAKAANLSTARKYAPTGIKVRAGFDKANLIKSELADEAHDIVKARFQHLLDDGIKSRNLPTQYIKRFGGEYSKRHLRRIRDEM